MRRSTHLLARLDELTKGWLLALLERASLDDAPGILAADLPRDGPRVCEAVVRALADDADLRRIEPDGQLELLVARTGQLAGATTPEASIGAVDTLEAVIWSAIRSELRDDDPDLLAEISERLSRIIGLVRSAVLRGAPSGATSGAPASPPGTHLRPLPDPQQPPRVPDPVAPEPTASRPEPPEPEDLETLTGDDQVWIGVLDRELIRAQRSGSPLSLLLLELEEAERAAGGRAADRGGRNVRPVRADRARRDAPSGHPGLRVERPGVDHRARYEQGGRAGARPRARRARSEWRRPGAGRR